MDVPTIDTRKPIGLNLNREGAAMLLRGLESLPPEDRNVVYQKLKQDLGMIVTIWDRRIKNEKILQENRRILRARQKAAKQPQLPQSQNKPAQKQPPEKPKHQSDKPSQ